MLKAINNFLHEAGKEPALRVHPTPSAKEFHDTFLFIYNIVFEDDHAAGAKKMDEEVTELLRVARYPWIDSLAKLSFTIITPHIWPHLLSTLHWMVQLYDVRNFWSWLRESLTSSSMIGASLWRAEIRISSMKTTWMKFPEVNLSISLSYFVYSYATWEMFG
jgi:SMC interacting uncharacterized protein involved in chromosome segregation